jgi:tRNA threonylcarbamoyl adenosine modification protein YeaZ
VTAAARGGAARDGRRHAILALDTATTQAVIAVGSLDGEPWGASTWAAGHRHGDTLLPNIGRLLGEANLRRSRLRAIVVGTGPGAFTGLRVGIATAKGLTHALRIPIVGIATSEALLAGVRGTIGSDALALLLPAGPSDRVLCRSGEAPHLLPGGTEPELRAGETLLAVDLAGRADDDAVARGEAARRELASQLLRLGAARLHAAPGGDDLARLVPEYVTLPRGVRTPVADTTVAVTTETR